MKKKTALIICTGVIMIFLMLFSACSSNPSEASEPDRIDTAEEAGNEDPPQEENYEVIKKYVEIRHNAAKLAAIEPEGQIYADLYILVETFRFYGQGEEAIAAARERYIEDSAIRWYAEKEGLLADDGQVETYLDTMEQACEETENGNEYAQACDAYGMTFRQWMEEDFESYRLTCTLQNVYNAVMADVKATDAADEWGTFTEENEKEYLNSAEYRKTAQEMDAILQRMGKVRS